MLDNNKTKKLTYILYDGICNSVFHSQVLQPILQLLEREKDTEVTLVSFERSMIDKEKLLQIIPAHDRLHLVIGKRIPFLGKISLWLVVNQFVRLHKYIRSSHIIARGPLAGFIAQHGIKKLLNIIPVSDREKYRSYLPTLTIQARGLAAEECRFVLERKEVTGMRSLLRYLFGQWIYYLYKRVELSVYCKKKAGDFSQQATIEAVSPALKEYLIKHFSADANDFVIACNDIPEPLNKEQIGAWRKQVRNQLGVPEDSYVYCYNGSARPWQCVDKMTDYFVKRYKKDPKSFFLVISQEKEIFAHKLHRALIPETKYTVLRVEPNQTYQYLSAADAGLLFRERDPVNWVSRPTKMLEYEAVGLKVIHNNTVAWLSREASV